MKKAKPKAKVKPKPKPKHKKADSKKLTPNEIEAEEIKLLSGIELHNLDAERLGMGVIYSNKIKPFIIDVNQHDNRNITIEIRGKNNLMAFTGTHAPHAGCSELIKDKYYDQITNIHENYAVRNNAHYFLGDFNARLLRQAPGEEHTIGPWIFNPTDEDFEILSDNQQNNRERFVACCLEDRYSSMNTLFEKEP